MSVMIVFNLVSIDGYFVDMKGDMSWAHNRATDGEWDDFVASNARGGGVLLFGRITYDLMASYWPTPVAAKNDPVVAERMNNLSKVVFSRTMEKAAWSNTRLVKNDPAAEVRKMKREGGADMALMGSGSIVARLANEGLIDEYQVVVVPFVLGAGRTMFEGVKERKRFILTGTRSFANGNVLLTYKPGA